MKHFLDWAISIFRKKHLPSVPTLFTSYLENFNRDREHWK